MGTLPLDSSCTGNCAKRGEGPILVPRPVGYQIGTGSWTQRDYSRERKRKKSGKQKPVVVGRLLG